MSDDGTVNQFFADMDHDQRKASTLASAIEINRPVNLKKCLRALDACDGVVRQVSDQQILDAKAQVGAGGFGCEPASGASVAGAKLLRAEGVIAPSDRVVCVLTGHQLKDPDITVAYHSGNKSLFDEKLRPLGVESAEFANSPIVVENNLQKIIEVLSR
jgi:threonine synthase